MSVISQIAVLFFLIVLGYVCAKTKLAGDDAPDVISPLVMNLTLPCLILISFQRPFSRELLGEAGIAVAASLMMYTLALPFVYLYPRIIKMNGQERGVHRYALLFTNCGYLGYPVTEAILGPGYIFHASFFNILFNLFAYSIGSWLVAKEGERKIKFSLGALVTPCVVATVIGLLLFLFSWELPGVLGRGLKITGDMTSPLSMLVIGMSLAKANMKQIWGRWQIYATSFLRLVFLPVLTGLVCWLSHIRGPLLVLAITLCAMPAAASTSIMAALYKSAPEEGSALVFMTTLLSMISIPLLAIAINAVF